MTKKTFCGIMAVLYILATTVLIFCGFFVLEPTKLNLIAISILSCIGYGTAYEFYLKNENKQGDYTLHLFAFIAIIVLIVSI